MSGKLTALPLHSEEPIIRNKNKKDIKRYCLKPKELYRIDCAWVYMYIYMPFLFLSLQHSYLYSRHISRPFPSSPKKEVYKWLFLWVSIYTCAVCLLYGRRRPCLVGFSEKTRERRRESNKRASHKSISRWREREVSFSISVGFFFMSFSST